MASQLSALPYFSGGIVMEYKDVCAHCTRKFVFCLSFRQHKTITCLFLLLHGLSKPAWLLSSVFGSLTIYWAYFTTCLSHCFLSYTAYYNLYQSNAHTLLETHALFCLWPSTSECDAKHVTCYIMGWDVMIMLSWPLASLVDTVMIWYIDQLDQGV